MRRRYLLERVDSVQQALLTSTDPRLFTEDFLKKAKVFRVEAGRVIE
jgi:recombinational DNA repair ATPase RecF